MSAANVVLVSALVLVAILIARRLKPILYEEQKFLFQVFEDVSMVSEWTISGSASEVSREIDAAKAKLTGKQRYVLYRYGSHEMEEVERSFIRA